MIETGQRLPPLGRQSMIAVDCGRIGGIPIDRGTIDPLRER